MKVIAEAVEKLLKKRKPGGEDLGRLYFFLDIMPNYVRKYGATFENIETATRYLDKYLPNLSSDQEEIYIDYSSLYNIVQIYNYLGQAYYQQVVRCFYRMMFVVDNLMDTSNFFAEIPGINEDFDIENIAVEFMAFIRALKRSFAIDQFFMDIEDRFCLYGLRKVFEVTDNLDQYIQTYNDVVKRLKEKREYDPLLLWLIPIQEKDYLPPEKKIKEARKMIKSIGSFRGKSISTEFFEAYVME